MYKYIKHFIEKRAKWHAIEYESTVTGIITLTKMYLNALIYNNHSLNFIQVPYLTVVFSCRTRGVNSRWTAENTLNSQCIENTAISWDDTLFFKCSTREHSVPDVVKETGERIKGSERETAAAGGCLRKQKQREDIEGKFLMRIRQMWTFVFLIYVFLRTTKIWNKTLPDCF